MTGALESYLMINFPTEFRNLSEQQLLDCVSIGDCVGGFPGKFLIICFNKKLIFIK